MQKYSHDWTGRLWRAPAVSTGAAPITLGALLLLTSAAAAQVDYYVSQAGSDSNAGTSPGAPFRHIQRCAELLQPGGTCHLMGGLYRETVRPARSGEANAPITYVNYQNQWAFVTGAEPVTGWQRVSTSELAELVSRDPTLDPSEFSNAVRQGVIYATTLTLPANSDGLQVFFDGDMLIEAQWPHPGTELLDPAMQFATGADTGDVVLNGTHYQIIDDSDLTHPVNYWAGARVYAHRWFVSQTTSVLLSDVGKLLLPAREPGACLPLEPNNTRYFLYGKPQAMTHAGSWYYDESTSKLYLWTPAGDDPANHDVEYGARELAFDLSDISHTKVSSLFLRAGTIRTGDSSTGVVLERLHASYLSHYREIDPDPPYTGGGCDLLTSGETTTGIILRGTGNSLIGSVIQYSAGNGVVVMGSGHTVAFNEIHDVNYLGTYAAGINIGGGNHNISLNTIYRTGRSGINVDARISPPVPGGPPALPNVTISYNDVSRYARLSTDTGAIYACCEIDFSGSSIHHNWVHDMWPMPYVNARALTGIYLDNGEQNALLHSNVGWNNLDGVIFLHGDSRPMTAIKVYNNTGGIRLLNIGDISGTELVNNIGFLRMEGTPLPILTTNLTAGDPRFVNPGMNDYRLQSGSPARAAGTFIPGITVGGTDAVPSIGAYQYGAAFWQAGAHQ